MDYRLFGSVERTKWRGRVECEVSGGCLMGEEIERAVVVEDDKIRRLRWHNELAKEMRNPLS
ncbi:hypothetical protein COLO4_33485 [Corchorus olitorius]|uniref:Uncharacterized protein n=1 Tax=Corchorus olitorius TaxID=93759 RepID=A0A1R3GT80_9ROSI|nr:hypothetical protein COLO4_33485 [Corchorus olitorius]